MKDVIEKFIVCFVFLLGSWPCKVLMILLMVLNWFHCVYFSYLFFLMFLENQVCYHFFIFEYISISQQLFFWTCFHLICMDVCKLDCFGGGNLLDGFCLATLKRKKVCGQLVIDWNWGNLFDRVFVDGRECLIDYKGLAVNLEACHIRRKKNIAWLLIYFNEH